MRTISKYLHLCVLVIIVGIASSCTRNGGDIGYLFGQWKLQSITIDGEPDADYTGNVFWSFAKSVIKMQQLAEGEVYATFGTWEQPTDDELVLHFTHTDAVPGSEWRYSPVPATKLPRGVLKMEMLEYTNSHLTLRYVAEDGRVMVYRLKKWG